MSRQSVSFHGLSGTTLKLLACAFMAIDHIGVRLLPNLVILRILGRLAFPMFAFFLAEGCRYTKNKRRHFLLIFVIGVSYFLVYLLYSKRLYGNIFMTFSVSILMIYLMQWCKKQIFSKKKNAKRILAPVLFALALLGTYFLFEYVHFEYGYLGMLLPVLLNIWDFKGVSLPYRLSLDRKTEHALRIALLIVGLLVMCIDANLGKIQFFSLLAVPFLALYNGKVGQKKMKYFFYVFYPTHLLIIEGLSYLL